MSNDEPTKDELEQRVDQLEQTVQRMMPNRRQTLKGLGLLGGGALLGGVGSQEAEAATGSAGNVGTSSDRPDVFADTVDANQVGNTSNRFTGYADTLDANVVSTDGLDYNNLIPDYRTAYYQPEHLDSDPTTTSTSYQNVFDIHGYFSPSDIPPNATLYGKFTTRMRNDTSNETTFAVPTGTDDGSLVDITELEVSVTSTTSTLVSSGWQELTSIQGMTEFTGFSRIAGKVSAGTGTYSRFSPGLEIAGSIQ